MLIRNWMTKDPITVTPDTSLMKASKILKEHQIRRIPVVDEEGKLLGIVTDRDIRLNYPSKATTLEVHELYYLLSELKVDEIMTKNPKAVSPTDTVEHAAQLLTFQRVGGMPVVDENNKVVGIITEMDVFKVLVDITGVKHGGVQYCFELPDEEGSLKPVMDDLKEHGARVVSVLTYLDKGKDDKRRVFIRVFPMDRAKEDAIIQEMQEKYNLLFWVRDKVHPLA